CVWPRYQHTCEGTPSKRAVTVCVCVCVCVCVSSCLCRINFVTVIAIVKLHSDSLSPRIREYQHAHTQPSTQLQPPAPPSLLTCPLSPRLVGNLWGHEATYTHTHTHTGTHTHTHTHTHRHTHTHSVHHTHTHTLSPRYLTCRPFFSPGFSLSLSLFLFHTHLLSLFLFLS